ncbi:hypothetical protein ACFLX9_04290 [Chloroflexota bacterium]
MRRRRQMGARGIVMGGGVTVDGTDDAGGVHEGSHRVDGHRTFIQKDPSNLLRLAAVLLQPLGSSQATLLSVTPYLLICRDTVQAMLGDELLHLERDQVANGDAPGNTPAYLRPADGDGRAI